MNWTYYPDAGADYEGIYCTDRDIQHREAVERMQVLGLWEDAIEDFNRTGKPLTATPPLGAFFNPAELDPAQGHVIKSFEEQNEATIYTGIESFTNFGHLFAYLFVSKYIEEWNLERADLPALDTLAYVYNCDAPELSEIGRIGIRLNQAGSLDRTW